MPAHSSAERNGYSTNTQPIATPPSSRPIRIRSAIIRRHPIAQSSGWHASFQPLRQASGLESRPSLEPAHPVARLRPIRSPGSGPSGRPPRPIRSPGSGPAGQNGAREQPGCSIHPPACSLACRWRPTNQPVCISASICHGQKRGGLRGRGVRCPHARKEKEVRHAALSRQSVDDVQRGAVPRPLRRRPQAPGSKAWSSSSPTNFPPAALRERLSGEGLTQVLFNMPPGDWADGRTRNSQHARPPGGIP